MLETAVIFTAASLSAQLYQVHLLRIRIPKMIVRLNNGEGGAVMRLSVMVTLDSVTTPEENSSKNFRGF
jgi:hypothetical protein